MDLHLDKLCDKDLLDKSLRMCNRTDFYSPIEMRAAITELKKRYRYWEQIALEDLNHKYAREILPPLRRRINTITGVYNILRKSYDQEI